MTSRAVLGLLVLALGAGCSAVSAEDASAPTESDLTMSELPVRMTDFAAGTFDQKLDHADAASPTFKQRYWYSTQFAKGPDAPVLYFICGESECSQNHLLGRGDIAKTLGAAVIVLEHRYYGKSLPFEDPKVEDMKYLTIAAALADLDAFETYAKANLGLGGKWIAVGGSYSGMLAAFYREKYPQQVVGAWASSAPVDMQLFWSGADEVTARALGPDCLKLHQQVMTTASDAFDDPARRADVFGRLKISFNLPEGLDDATKKSWKRSVLGRIAAVPRSLAQEDMVRPYCAALAQEADPVDGFGLYRSPPLVPDETAPPPPPPPTGAPPAKGEGVGTNSFVMWNYQTCTEMGFFEVASTNRAMSVRSELDDGQDDLARCTSFWHTQPNVDATRAEYFAPIANGQVTNLFFVNGSLDPWSALSLHDPATAPAGVTEHIVQLATHTQDLQGLLPTSLLGVFEAHKKFHDLAVTWLAEP